MPEDKQRCGWANHSDQEKHYHDEEWGIPVHDDLHLFRMLILEGKQAGLSWSTILAKRESMCAAFDNFDPNALIRYDERKVEELLKNDGIIRSRQKIHAAIHNAGVYFDIVREHGSLDAFLWRYVDHRPIINAWERLEQIPASTSLSATISRDLKKAGFKYVGPTIVYAFMQAVGMVNDHLVSCFCYRQIT